MDWPCPLSPHRRLTGPAATRWHLATALDPELRDGCAFAAFSIPSKHLSVYEPASRVSHRHKRPFLALLRLFIPLPTWHFPVPQPVSFKIMLNGIPLLMSRMASADLTNMRNVPIWRAKDTPLRSLYRIYEAMVAREYYAVGREVEYCWCQNVVAGSPAPSRPVRRGSRSVLSPCLYRRRPRQGVNRRLGLGMRRDRNKHVYRKMIDEEFPLFTPETPPFWTRTVPAFGVELTAGLPGVSFGFVG